MPLSKITGNSFNASANTNIDNGTLFINPTTNRVGIGTATPTDSLRVGGNVSIDGALRIKGTEPDDDGRFYVYVNDTEVVFQGNESSLQTDKQFVFSGGNQGGDKIVTLRNGGINFGSDTADANLLDDYEEGTTSGNLIANSGVFTLATYTGRYNCSALYKNGRYETISWYVYFYPDNGELFLQCPLFGQIPKCIVFYKVKVPFKIPCKTLHPDIKVFDQAEKVGNVNNFSTWFIKL
jgi:hypothetical protein